MRAGLALSRKQCGKFATLDVQAIQRDAIREGMSGHPQQPGDSVAVCTSFLHRLDDTATLDRFVFAIASFDHFHHLHRLLFATRLLSKLLNRYRQVSHPDALPIPKHDAAFDRILKFPNVTGPRVGFEHCEHRIVKLNANTICRYPPGQR